MLLEIYDQDTPEEYQDVGDDNSRPQLGDLRKSKLTLKQLNKLRKLNDIRQIEFGEKMERVKSMYGASDDVAM